MQHNRVTLKRAGSLFKPKLFVWCLHALLRVCVGFFQVFLSSCIEYGSSRAQSQPFEAYAVHELLDVKWLLKS